MSGFRDRYGDRPLHLIAVIAAFGIAGYAFVQVARNPGPLSFAIFFAGAIVCHDLIAFPVYSLLDRIGGRAVARPGSAAGRINYLRVPALLSAFALVVWFPLILGLDTANYESAAATPPADYLARWLGLTGVLFLGSGLVYALRRRRSAHDSDPPRDRPGPRTRR